MHKKVIPIILALLLSLSIVPGAAAADGPSVDAAYSSGVVTVRGSNFSSGAEYTIRIVNQKLSSIAAMDQVKADAGGSFSASVTTGALGTLSDYIVYVNNQDGTLAGQDSTLTAATAPSTGTKSGSGSAPANPTQQVTVGNGMVVSEITGTPDSSGKVSVSVNPDTAQSLLDNAKKLEAAGGKAVIKIKVTASSGADMSSAGISMGKDAFNQIASQTEASVSLETSVGTVTFSPKAIEAIADAASADLEFLMTRLDPDSLSDAVKAEVGNRPVYNFSITSGGNAISDFGGGSAEISLPYTPESGEDLDAIVAYYIDAAGNLQVMRGVYNPATGMMDFIVPHFSAYFVGYNKVTFADVTKGAWYENAVEFCAARGITTGIDSYNFGPDATLTRGQFIVMLMRAYGLEADSRPADNFIDAGNTYYTGYLSAAKRLSITDGVGNNRFDPDRVISRQELFTLLYRALDLLGELPSAVSGRTLAGFSDTGDIADYAKAPMEALVKGGIVGGSGGRLNPENTSTRAQMVQVLYNTLKL